MNDGAAGVIAAAITGVLALIGVIYTVYTGPRAANQQAALKEKRDAENANLEEAKRLRDEAWRLKEEADERAESCKAEAERWQRGYWTLSNSANKMLARCGSSVSTALSFLDDKRDEPAKKELSKLEAELNDYHLPDAPKND